MAPARRATKGGCATTRSKRSSRMGSNRSPSRKSTPATPLKRALKRAHASARGFTSVAITWRATAARERASAPAPHPRSSALSTDRSGIDARARRAVTALSGGTATAAALRSPKITSSPARATRVRDVTTSPATPKSPPCASAVRSPSTLSASWTGTGSCRRKSRAATAAGSRRRRACQARMGARRGSSSPSPTRAIFAMKRGSRPAARSAPRSAPMRASGIARSRSTSASCTDGEGTPRGSHRHGVSMRIGSWAELGRRRTARAPNASCIGRPHPGGGRRRGEVPRRARPRRGRHGRRRRRDARAARRARGAQVPAARASPSNPEVVQRFVREARAAVKIKSEHVARVLDVGTLENGAPYMVMEYLDGEDLAQSSRGRGPLPVERGGRLRPPGVRGDRRGARARHRPPRSQAGEPVPRSKRRTAGPSSRCSTSGSRRSAGRRRRPP